MISTSQDISENEITMSYLVHRIRMIETQACFQEDLVAANSILGAQYIYVVRSIEELNLGIARKTSLEISRKPRAVHGRYNFGFDECVEFVLVT